MLLVQVGRNEEVEGECKHVDTCANAKDCAKEFPSIPEIVHLERDECNVSIYANLNAPFHAKAKGLLLHPLELYLIFALLSAPPR